LGLFVRVLLISLGFRFGVLFIPRFSIRHILIHLETIIHLLVLVANTCLPALKSRGSSLRLFILLFFVFLLLIVFLAVFYLWRFLSNELASGGQGCEAFRIGGQVRVRVVFSSIVQCSRNVLGETLL
jgi:hypothetical protein